jgi:hypothetical protein
MSKSQNILVHGPSVMFGVCLGMLICVGIVIYRERRDRGAFYTCPAVTVEPCRK